MKKVGHSSVRRLTQIFGGVFAVPVFVLGHAWAHKLSTSPTSLPQTSASDNRASVPSPDSIHVQSNLVSAPVTVTDPFGNFVQNLREEQFQVWDDGVAQRITYFNAATEPVTAVIVIQTSKEVAPMLPAIQPLGILLSDLLLGNSGEAAVVTYADQSELIQKFSSEPETLAGTLRTIHAGGSKNARLNDALERAISMLSHQTRAKRRVVIVFSEGFDRGSVTSGAEVVRAASYANVTIYGIRFNPAGTELRADSKSTLQQVFAPCPLAANRAHPWGLSLLILPHWRYWLRRRVQGNCGKTCLDNTGDIPVGSCTRIGETMRCRINSRTSHSRLTANTTWRMFRPVRTTPDSTLLRSRFPTPSFGSGRGPDISMPRRENETGAGPMLRERGQASPLKWRECPRRNSCRHHRSIRGLL